MIVQNSYTPPSCCSQHACFLAAASYTKCCFVSHSMSPLSLFGRSVAQFLPWIGMFPESCSPTTLHPLQHFAECVLILSHLRSLFALKQRLFKLQHNSTLQAPTTVLQLPDSSEKMLCPSNLHFSHKPHLLGKMQDGILPSFSWHHFPKLAHCLWRATCSLWFLIQLSGYIYWNRPEWLF